MNRNSFHANIFLFLFLWEMSTGLMGFYYENEIEKNGGEDYVVRSCINGCGKFLEAKNMVLVHFLVHFKLFKFVHLCNF